ncbi:MAG: phosphate ABC transporter, permease protein PstA, partial [Thermodesulfobacteriota bacterium]
MSTNPKSAAGQVDKPTSPPPRKIQAVPLHRAAGPVREPKVEEDERPPVTPAPKRSYAWDFRAAGEPFVWGMGGALVIGILMIVGFLIFVVYNGILTFYPEPLYVVKLKDNKQIAGELFRTEVYKVEPDALKELPDSVRKEIEDQKGFAKRNLYRIGNFDLYNEDFRWTPTY